jgi:FdhD protein
MQIDELTDRLAPLPPYEPWSTVVLMGIVDAVRAQQDLFNRTGGVHAAAAFDRSGSVLVVREDIGRHNAVDKVIGNLLLDERLPASRHGLFVSGRASFEMVQKAWAAGFEALIAVSAPSALAVRTAEVAGLTLAGFIRDDAFNIYSRPSDGRP